MLELLEFILATAGLTYIVTKSTLFKPLRESLSDKKLLSKILNCPLCFGFWAGMLVFILDNTGIFPWFLHGLIGAISSYAIYVFFTDPKDPE